MINLIEFKWFLIINGGNTPIKPQNSLTEKEILDLSGIMMFILKYFSSVIKRFSKKAKISYVKDNSQAE